MKITDEILWDYADDLLSTTQKAFVENELAQNVLLQNKLQEIRSEKKSWTSISMEKPSQDFAQNVMAAWLTAQQSKVVFQPSKIPNMIGIFVSILLVLFLFIIFSNLKNMQVLVPTYSVSQYNFAIVGVFAIFFILFIEKLIYRKMMWKL